MWDDEEIRAAIVRGSGAFRGNLRLNRRGVLAITLAFFTLFFVQVHASQAIYQFKETKKSAQFKHLLKEMRCLVCQNQDLSDSGSGLAEDLRAKVYNMVNEGRSDTEIMDYFTQHYGDFIAFKPPFKVITLFLWLAPLFFVLSGLAFFLKKFMQGDPR